MTMMAPSGVQSPAAGVNYGDFPMNVIELTQRQLTQYGRVGATKVYAVPALPAPIAAGTNVQSVPQNIRWREPGTVIALYGQELAGTPAKFAQTSLRVQIGGQEDLWTDGQTGVFLPMLAAFGAASNWFPMWRRVRPGTDWTVTYANFDVLATAFPSAFFAFIADADVARAMPPKK